MFLHGNRSACLAAFLALLFAPMAGAAEAESPMDTYRLTESGLDRYEKATVAVYEFLRAHPELEESLAEEADEDAEDPTFADMARRFESRAPGIGKAARDAGMPLEEYFQFTMVFAMNAFTVAMMDQFGGGEDADMSAVARDNVAFVRKHQQRFTDFDARMKEKYGDLMDD